MLEKSCYSLGLEKNRGKWKKVREIPHLSGRDEVIRRVCNHAWKKGTNSWMPLVTAYNPHNLFISGMANRKCHSFSLKPKRLAKLFKKRPLNAYRRRKRLRNVLVSAKLRGKTIKDEVNTENSCEPYNKTRCSWCLLIEKPLLLQAQIRLIGRLTFSTQWLRTANERLWFISLNAGYVNYNTKGGARNFLIYDLVTIEVILSEVSATANSQSTFYTTPESTILWERHWNGGNWGK